MADERGRSDDARLEVDLVDVGRQLEYPPTPDIAAAVRARLSAQPTPLPVAPTRVRRVGRWPALAAASLLVVLVGALAIIPDTRESIADRLGLRGVEIVTTPTTTLPEPPLAGQTLLLGEPTTLDDAFPMLDYAPFLPPPSLGAPDAVYVLEPPLGGQLSYVYLPSDTLPEAPETGVGVLISQFPGDTNESFIGKQLSEDTTLEVVTVNGTPGFWIAGAPHLFAYEDANGEFRQETLRLAANVLLWEADGITLRIESAMPRDEVVTMAESMTR